MEFNDIADILRKRGYVDYETKEHYRVFYEFDRMDFLYSDCAKKFEMEYHDGKVEKVIMTQYWFGHTEFQEITDLEKLRKWS